MRVVGGKFRGRPLVTPESAAIRPTSDRTRESLFNIISHSFPEKLENTRVLDMFAGTGSLGLEALSRGCRYTVFIEESVEGRGLLRQNVEAFGLQGNTKVFRRNATQLGPTGTMGEFDLVFADPPYGKGLGEQAFVAALEGGWLKPDALLVLEEVAEAAITLDDRFVLRDERNYGITTIRFYELA
ncbi:16S rRNA (guanine(966)-N(2))-methyltransferase RsmD [Pseudochrobactrum sp. MP213Fo]|uniref:16S rRNA (guanine(966)-N(2))-methyltransferase RsmD n=1 Tax=Pseudochrobactrum sp. MP213Fo TaxID=3022250 RepID=UPI003BA2FA80